MSLVQELLILTLLQSFNAYEIYNVRVVVETSADEGNDETNVYLTLMTGDRVKLTEEKRLGKFDEGEVREFLFNANIEENTKVGCLKFTLKDGTDGWTMERSTVVTKNGKIQTFENRRRKKLDNTFPWQENSLEFCSSETTEFELVDQYGRNVTKQHEGLLLYNGGTVCDDQFNDDSARAICRALGRPSQRSTWKSYPEEFKYMQFQSQKTIKLGINGCLNHDGMWFYCSFTTSPQCKHEEDVFLTCSDGNTGGSVMSTTVIIAVIAACLTFIGILSITINCIVRRKHRREQRIPSTEPPISNIEPSARDEEPLRSVNPSAPPQYEQETEQNGVTDALPSYDEVISSPTRFNLSRSSFRKLSAKFTRNNAEHDV